MINIPYLNTLDINTPKSKNNFELMNDIKISLKDLKNLATFTLLKEKIERNNSKKTFNKILMEVNNYE